MVLAAVVLIVEADNALGSRRGDVDDGLALAALFAAHRDDLVVVSAFGNTSEPEADRNNRALAEACGVHPHHLRGAARRGATNAEGVAFLCDAGHDTVLLALGPLTTLAAALSKKPDLALAQVVLVGGDMTSRGRWPPLWPHEFNFWLDRPAARAVFASRLPLTLVPIDVGRRLLLSPPYLDSLTGRAGVYLRQHAARRLVRNRWLLGVDGLRAYDLLAAMVQLAPGLLQFRNETLRLHPRGFIELGRGRQVRVVTDFDGPALLAMFAASIAQRDAETSVARVP